MDGPKHSHSPDICNTYHNMKNNLRKSVLTSCLAMTVLCVSATTQVNKQKRSQMVVNPLLRPSTLPYGAPDFSKIKDTDYMPALKAGIEQQRQEINRTSITSRSLLSLTSFWLTRKADSYSIAYQTFCLD